MPRRFRTKKVDKMMAASAPDAKHHTSFSDNLCSQYRRIGPASILAALLFRPTRDKAAGSGKEA